MPLRRMDANGRAILSLANEIAHEFELEYVGPEHILLAILRHGDNVAARTLAGLGVTEARAREQIDELVERSKEDTWVFGRLPGTSQFQDVIERAMKCADQLEASLISSEHLLLALFHDQHSPAQQSLAAMGVTHRKCRDEVLRQLSSG